MRHLTIFSLPFSFSMLQMALLPVYCLLCFGAANGLASQTWYYYSLYYTVGDTPRTSSPIVKRVFFDHQVSDDLVKWPFLSQYSRYTESTWSWFVYYLPQYSFYGSNKYPWCYSPDGSGSFSVPDDWDSDDLQQMQDSYDSLSFAQQSALTGAPVCGNQGDKHFFYFPHRPMGSYVAPGGVSTFDSDGIPIVSYPDSSGYATGHKPLPDGSYTPVYYTLNGTTVTESPSIPTTDYSSLSYDTGTGQYSLNVPDYSPKLDTIISRIDNIDLHIPDINVTPDVTVNVPAPDVTVNVPAPDVTVNVPAPEVTVNVPAPEVTVNIPDSISSSVDSISRAVSNIQSDVEVSGDVASMPSFADLTLTSEEQSLVSQYSNWETNIPLIGDAVDFGLTTLFGKLPTVGTEYVWLDYTIGSSSPSKSSPSLKAPASSANPLNGYRIRIDLTSYRDVLLAARGIMIIGEALLFMALCYRDIKKALAV